MESTTCSLTASSLSSTADEVFIVRGGELGMGVKCGKCQEFHESSAEVRECYGVAPRLRDEEPGIKLSPGRKLPAAASDANGVSGGGNFTPGSVTPSGPRPRAKEPRLRLTPGRKLPAAASDSSGVSGGGNFTPGSVTPYGTGTVRATGTAEADTRESCEHCGAKVASGQAHDC